jgi:hypothetical protein
MEEDVGATVELFVYDLTKGMAHLMSQMLLGEWCYMCVVTAVDVYIIHKSTEI